MDTVSEIKSRSDIAEFIGQYTKLTRSGKTLKGLCPFHSEKRGSFFVYPEQQTWHCFGSCGTGGDIFSFIMKKEGLSFGEAVERLADKYGVALKAFAPASPEREQHDELLRVNAAAAQYYHDLLLNSDAAVKARQYLEFRGINQKSIDDFQLGYALPGWQSLKDHLNGQGYQDDLLLEAGLLGSADSGRTYDRFRDQLMIPICDIKGRITGFGARVLNDSVPKYLNSPETPVFSKSSTLFGINLAASAIRQADRAIIVEGYFDVIVSHQAGFTNTVASMGTAVTEKQINILRKISRNLILALDADSAGEEAMTRCIPHENILGQEIKVAVAPPGNDPDDVIRRDPVAWKAVLDQAGPLTEFVFKRSSADYNLTTAAGKSELTKYLLPVISVINDPVRRGHYLTELARMVGVDTAELQFSLNRLKPTAVSAAKGNAGSAAPPVTAAAVEDYLLAIWLRHPELAEVCQSVKPAYFSTAENREIFIQLRETADLAAARAALDQLCAARFDRLLELPEPASKLTERLAECALRLEEKYLKATSARIKEAINTAAGDDSEAEINKYHEQSLVINDRLAEIFRQKNELHHSSGR
jgi:DNA primase